MATVSGDIDLTAERPLEEGDFESVSGNIKVRAALADQGDFSFESISGKIELLLPTLRARAGWWLKMLSPAAVDRIAARAIQQKK